MTVRFFRGSPSVYASIVNQLNLAYGYPNPETKTARALPELESLPTDAQGRVYVAVLAVYCEYNLPGQMLPQLIESGDIEEISEAQYDAAAR